MIATTSPFDAFCGRIVQSGLIDEISAHEAISDWRLAATEPNDVRQFAARLVENNLLTSLQAENVLAVVIQPEQLDQYRLGEHVTTGQLGNIFTALGLDHLHSMGTIHRDINPTNLWITSDGVTKLLEFGSTLDELEFLDRNGDAEGVTMVGGSVIGTFDYMPPEQALDSHSVNERSDIYALGCVLYHCLTGQPPFPDNHPVRQMMRHANEPPRPIEELRKDIPYALDETVRTMLAKRPEDRFEASADVAKILVEYADPDTVEYTAGTSTSLTAAESAARQSSMAETIFRKNVIDDELVARFRHHDAFQTGSINQTLASLSDLIDSAAGRIVLLD